VRSGLTRTNEGFTLSILRDYARIGAQVRIVELNPELEAIYSAFPDLRPGSRKGSSRRKVVVNHEEQVTGSASELIKVEETGRAAAPVRRRRRKMTAAERKAIGERMRKYWAAKAAASGKKG
jgi:hypothetical protein